MVSLAPGAIDADLWTQALEPDLQAQTTFGPLTMESLWMIAMPICCKPRRVTFKFRVSRQHLFAAGSEYLKLPEQVFGPNNGLFGDVGPSLQRAIPP